jgi:hypothetical protein
MAATSSQLLSDLAGGCAAAAVGGFFFGAGRGGGDTAGFGGRGAASAPSSDASEFQWVDFSLSVMTKWLELQVVLLCRFGPMSGERTDYRSGD